TPMQQGMLFHYLKEPTDGLYFEQLCLELFPLELSGKGEIKKGHFENAWNTVIQTNEMLRTRFRWEKIKNPVQVILKQHKIKPRYYNSPVTPGGVPVTSGAAPPISLEEIKAKDRQEGFDLREVPFRITLYKHGDRCYTMIISHHHILYDGWSSGIILKEFFAAYDALSKGKFLSPIVKTAFKDFIKWSQVQDKHKEKEFWKSYLNELSAKTTPSAMPAKKTRKRNEIKATEDYIFIIPPETQNRLEQSQKKRNITLASQLYCAWGLLLKQHNTAGSILFDTTVSGRTAKVRGIEDMVGLFINTLPMHLQTAPGDTIEDFLTRTGSMLQTWSQYENSSLADVNEYLDDIPDYNRFRSLLVLENYPLDKMLAREKGILTVKDYSISGQNNYDLTLIITTFDEIQLHFTYNTRIFSSEITERLAGHFLNILDDFTRYPQKKISGLEIPLEPLKTGSDMLEETREEIKPDQGALPGSDTEKRLAAIWAEVLKIDKRSIGIDDNFFDFGGHSLKASLLVSKVHKEFNVKIPLFQLFSTPFIRELAKLIEQAGTGRDIHTAIEPAEQKTYYPLSSVQKRLYMIRQMEPDSIAYNGPTMLLLESKTPKGGLSLFPPVLKQLIARHEILRTSFTTIGGEPVQKIHEPGELPFVMEYYDSDGAPRIIPETGDDASKTGMASMKTSHLAPVTTQFVRPFDLSKAPLLRIGAVEAAANKFILLVDMHHI
ncbi:MAG: hypothetical protein GY757_13015, partial [bacterium]|nr:hypothetical protein [bacterium]